MKSTPELSAAATAALDDLRLQAALTLRYMERFHPAGWQELLTTQIATICHVMQMEVLVLTPGGRKYLKSIDKGYAYLNGAEQIGYRAYFNDALILLRDKGFEEVQIYRIYKKINQQKRPGYTTKQLQATYMHIPAAEKKVLPETYGPRSMEGWGRRHGEPIMYARIGLTRRDVERIIEKHRHATVQWMYPILLVVPDRAPFAELERKHRGAVDVLRVYELPLPSLKPVVW